MHGQAADVDPRGVQELGDQAGHPVGVGLDRLEHQPLLVVGEPVPVAQQGRAEALDPGERGAQLVRHGRQQCGALGLGPAPPLGVAQPEHHGTHRLPRAAAHVLGGDEQLAARGQHEQPLAVARARHEPTPGVGDRPPRLALEVLQGQRLADVAAQDVGRRQPGDALGPRVHEPHRGVTPHRGDQAVGDELQPVDGQVVGDPERLRHVAHATRRSGHRRAGPPTRRGRWWRPWRG